MFNWNMMSTKFSYTNKYVIGVLRNLENEYEYQWPYHLSSKSKKLIKIRKANPVVVYGEYKLILEENKEIFAYTRTLENEKLLIINNNIIDN